jgi:hypothetical protein
MYSIVLYLIIVIPNVIKRYWHREDVSKAVKVLNILVPMLFFMFYIEEFRTRIWDIYENGFDTLWGDSNVVIITKGLDTAINIAYILLCFYVSVLFLNLASRIKSCL